MFDRIRAAALPAVAALALSAVLAVPAGADQIITLHSGNGTVGGADSQITFLQGPLDTGFGSAFTPADFAAAGEGSSATVVNPHGAWITAASFNANASTAAVPAQWISNSPSGALASGDNGSSALYAIEFTITDAVVSAASIDFDFAVDNLLGTTDPSHGFPNAGLFLNGTALSGSTSGGGFTPIFNFTRSDIAPLLVSGTNTLYINVTDVGGPAGLIFSTTITTEGSTSVAVPEPGLIAMFALGIFGLGVGRWAHNRRI
tara:strand:- start:4950 stop:5729 length:780 start_codon:yes stop_codon:yes gene_type:complete